MSSVPGVYCSITKWDADHNRSVITLAGEPDASGSGYPRAGKALELIDMNKHTGAHRASAPRTSFPSSRGRRVD